MCLTTTIALCAPPRAREVTGPVPGRADAQTLIGAVCFLVGSGLLLPERTQQVSGQELTPAATSPG